MKVKILKAFRDTYTKELLVPGPDAIEMTPERYEEAAANLSKWPGPFLEIVEPEPPKEPVGEPENTPDPAENEGQQGAPAVDSPVQEAPVEEMVAEEKEPATAPTEEKAKPQRKNRG